MLHNIDLDKMNALTEKDEEVKQLVHQLLENHRTVVSTISHELRNSLTLVSSSLQLIETKRPDITELSNWTLTMDNVDFMRQLLEDLSLFNNSAALHCSVFSMEQFLKELVLSFAIALDEEESDVELVSHIPSDLGNFTGDRYKIEEVLLNLLRNAKDAVSETGMIQLSTERCDKEIVIHIQDDGCGIPVENIDSIFEPFQTYKRGGTGLGLSLSKQIVEAHNGTLTVESEVGKGTTFTIVLPI